MFKWADGEVIENKHWTDKLYSLRIKADIEPYQAGQFGRLGLQLDPNDETITGRPYSFVSAPDEDFVEFYSIVVPEGPVSPRLGELKAGDHVYVNKKANGFFTMQEVPDGKHLWMLSTGTALGPFLSILKTATPWERFEKFVLVHAVRTAEELTYREQIDEFSQQHPDRFTYIPFVSRENTDFAIKGRVPKAIKKGTLEERAGIEINPSDSQVMICGNPAMVTDTKDVLIKRGLTKNLRKTPGQITTENYW